MNQNLEKPSPYYEGKPSLAQVQMWNVCDSTSVMIDPYVQPAAASSSHAYNLRLLTYTELLWRQPNTFPCTIRNKTVTFQFVA